MPNDFVRQHQLMHPIPVAIIDNRKRTVNEFIPGWVISLLGTLQTILWLAIIALEGGSIYYDAGRGTIYAGFWCSGFLFITWISMFCYLCCGKSRGCGIYLLVINSINMLFSTMLLFFTVNFVNNPCLCYGYLCSVPPWALLDSEISINIDPVWISFGCTARTVRKIPVLKGLLACAVLMLLYNLVYILTYIDVSIWLSHTAKRVTPQSNVTFQKELAYVNFEHPETYPSSRTSYVSQNEKRSCPASPVNNGHPKSAKIKAQSH